jgi:hypothetical protein
MSRDTTPDIIAAATAPIVRPFVAVEMLYPDGPVRVTSLDRIVSIESPSTGMQADWYGTPLGEISAIEEGAEDKSYGFTLSLSGIPGNWSTYLRTQDVQGRGVSVLLGFVDRLYNVIGTQVITVGFMDAQDVQAGETTAVVVSCESIQADWARARVRRYTDVDHQQRHPGDNFFKYVAALENQTLRWGK